MHDPETPNFVDDAFAEVIEATDTMAATFGAQIDDLNELVETLRRNIARKHERIERYARLIRWLAMPYTYHDPETGDLVVTDPMFPDYDPFTKTELEGPRELSRTWYEVVRNDFSRSPATAEEEATAPEGAATKER